MNINGNKSCGISESKGKSFTSILFRVNVCVKCTDASKLSPTNETYMKIDCRVCTGVSLLKLVTSSLYW